MHEKHILYIFFVIVLLIFIYNICHIENISEHITDNIYDEYIDTYPIYIQPWWNSTRHTRNMSYDLRGDIKNPYWYTGPWSLSPLLLNT